MANEQVVSPPIVENETTAVVDTQVVETDVNAGEASQATVASTDAVTTDEKPLSLFETVKKNLAEEQAEKDGATSSTEEKEKVEAKTDAKAEGEGEQKGESDEDIIKALEEKDPRSRAATRIRELVGEVKKYEADAGNFNALSTWVKDSNLQQQEFMDGLNIMRAMKNDPFAALEMLRPYYEELQNMVGEVLPDDIQQKLDTGLIDEDTAKELVKAKRQAEFLQSTQQRQQEQAAEQQEIEAQRAHVHAISNAVTSWEKSWQATDPDYPKKKSMVKNYVSSLMASEGVPTTPQEAVEQAKRARQMVEDELRSIAPTKKAITPPPTTPASKTTPQFKSSLDAARAALNQS